MEFEEYYESLAKCLNSMLNGKEKINISDLAKIFGISNETLRKYDMQNILIPYREENLYRTYSSWELTKLIRTRQLRAEGYSIKEIKRHFDTIGLDEDILNIEKRENEILDEIKKQKKLLSWLKKRKRVLIEARCQGDNISICHTEKLYCCVYMVDNTMVSKNDEQMKELKKWLNELPCLNIYYIGFIDSKVFSCLGITEKERREYKLYDLVPDFILPESEAAVFNIYTYKGNQIDTSEINISDSFERICRIGYKHQNVFVIKMLEYMQKDGLYTCLNQIRIPLKGA